MPTIRRCQPLLGTLVEIALAGDCSEDALHGLASEAFARIRAIEQALGFHRIDSELARVNRSAATRRQTISLALREVMTEALWLSELTDGVFDVCVAAPMVSQGLLPDICGRVARGGSWRDITLCDEGMRFTRPLLVDLGGIAKGYAVDRAFDPIPTDIDVCINAGGDLRMRPWHAAVVGVSVPDHEHAVRFAMRDQALATSIGRRGVHASAILDPATGVISEDPRSFSVWSITAMRADALTKIACLAPLRAEWITRAGGQAIALDTFGDTIELTAPRARQRATGP